MKNFLTRLLTSVLILAIFGVMVIASFHRYVFELTVSLISMMCIYEAVNAIGFAKCKRFLVPSLIYAFFVPLSFLLVEHINKSPYYLIIILTFIYMISFILISMLNFNKIKFNDAATIMFVSLVITCFLSNIILLRRMNEHGLFYMLLVIVCFSWATDVFAYLVGMCIGKHRFAPNISPKKTIEGSVGGSVISVAVTFAALMIYKNITGVSVNFPLALIYALICSIVGQIGDLAFSYIKRSYKIKDFGNLLPGHGGVLDRLDSLIFLSPFFYMLITFKEFLV